MARPIIVIIIKDEYFHLAVTKYRVAVAQPTIAFIIMHLTIIIATTTKSAPTVINLWRLMNGQTYY